MSSRTKDRIAETLFQLLQKKPLDKITVKELVEECEVTRQTFYYHFQDLMDVLEWSVQGEMERIGQECRKVEEPIEALRVFIAYAVEGKPIIEKLLESQHRQAIEKIMMETIREYLRELAAERNTLVKLSEQDTEVALDFYSCAIVGTLLVAGARGAVDVDQLARQMYQLIYGHFINEEV